jgi:4-oxalocrotonate tautomerase
MPLVNIKLWTGRTAEQKEKLMKDVTETVCKSIGCPGEAVEVIITEVPKENWAFNGVPASKRK